MILLDTDIVTLVEYGKSEALRLKIVSVESQDLAVTVVTWMERMQGRFESILKAADEGQLCTAIERHQRTKALLGDFRVVEADAETARHFERLRTNKSIKMRRGDMLIACIALAHGALVVTRNLKDYKDVPGLKVQNWAD